MKLQVVVWILLTALMWGSYGALLARGSINMGHDRMRPFICVGVAYLLVAIVAPLILLGPAAGRGWTVAGTTWSLMAGGAGAIGALGLLLALNAGGVGSQVYVMPLVFGLAPAVNAFVSISLANRWNQISPFFLAGLVVTALGAVMVLFFAPGGAPATKTSHASPNTSVPAPASQSPASSP